MPAGPKAVSQVVSTHRHSGMLMVTPPRRSHDFGAEDARENCDPVSAHWLCHTGRTCAKSGRNRAMFGRTPKLADSADWALRDPLSDPSHPGKFEYSKKACALGRGQHDRTHLKCVYQISAHGPCTGGGCFYRFPGGTRSPKMALSSVLLWLLLATEPANRGDDIPANMSARCTTSPAASRL